MEGFIEGLGIYREVEITMVGSGVMIMGGVDIVTSLESRPDKYR